jgi:hypothetical protein
MKTEITYRITNELQRELAKDGQPAHKTRNISVDLTPLLKETPNEVHVYHNGSLHLRTEHGHYTKGTDELIYPVASLIDEEDFYAFYQADRKREREEKIDEAEKLLSFFEKRFTKTDPTKVISLTIREIRYFVNESENLPVSLLTGDHKERFQKLKNNYKHIHEQLERDERNRLDASIKKREEREERKHKQLTEAINKVGTETQKQRWSEDVMPMAEAIYILKTAECESLLKTPLVVYLDTSKYHLPEIDDVVCKESEKRTLNDSQFREAKKVRGLMPSWEYEYFVQYYDDSEYDEKRVYIRLSKKVGEFDLDCDVLIGN